MKTIIKYSLAAVLSFGMLGISFAATINAGTFNGTDVGLVDTFLFEAAKQGNPASEEDWVNSVLASSGVTVKYTVKDEGTGGNGVPYYQTDETGIFAFAFDSKPGDEYFIIKNAKRIALFQNLADFDWGVFDTSLLSKAMNLGKDGDKFTISHVTSFEDPNAPVVGGDDGTVPEPTALLLIGTGLLGLFGATRKKA